MLVNVHVARSVTAWEAACSMTTSSRRRALTTARWPAMSTRVHHTSCVVVTSGHCWSSRALTTAWWPASFIHLHDVISRLLLTLCWIHRIFSCTAHILNIIHAYSPATCKASKTRQPVQIFNNWMSTDMFCSSKALTVWCLKWRRMTTISAKY